MASLVALSRAEITPEMIARFISYDPDTGILTWKRRDDSWFPKASNRKAWNTRCAGKPCFKRVNFDGYLTGKIGGKWWPATHIAWACFYGKWPEHEIDHIDGDRTNNRICNLRDVSHHGNMRNTPLKKCNTSGHCGVSFDRRSNKWRAKIGRLELGRFSDKRAAIVARSKAERAFGYHPNHGKPRSFRSALHDH